LYYSLQDKFIHFYGTHDELLNQHGISVSRIVNDFNKSLK